MAGNLNDIKKCTPVLRTDNLAYILTNRAFKLLDPPAIENIAVTFTRKSFPKYCPIVEQGREVHDVILIIKGMAHIVIRDHCDREHICGTLHSGDFILDNAIFTGHTATTNVIPLKPVECLLQHKTDFLKMLENHPDLMDYFYKIPMLNAWQNFRIVYGEPRLDGPSTDITRQIPINIKKSLAIIDRLYHDPLTLDALSKESGMSRYYFSRLFKKYTGCSFKKYLNLKRIEGAKNLMKKNALNVSEACFRVGYNDLSYFSRIFKAIEGVSPSAFRKSLKK